MSYANTSRRPNPLAALGALGVPSAVGAVLVLGLAVTATIKPADEGLDGFLLPEEKKFEPLPEPEIEPRSDAREDAPTTPVPDIRPAPRPDTPFDFTNGASDPIGGLPDILDSDFGRGVGLPDIEIPAPLPRFDPVAASPRGNPGGWITDADYRSSWINRGMTGTAGFTLQIDLSGRVTDCTITRSTGHGVLDEATCKLLERRARFEPARDAAGERTAGTFSSSVSWQIPE
jgi:protein TonB